MFHGIYHRWNQRCLSLTHLGYDVIPRRGCTGVEFYANDPVNHFIHAPSSRSQKSTPFPAGLSEPAFRKRTYTVTKTLHTWNVAPDTTKVESISVSDSKCREIKDSSSFTRLLNLDDTWIDSVNAVLDIMNNHFSIFMAFYFIVANVLQSWMRTILQWLTHSTCQLYLQYMTVTVRKSFVTMKLLERTLLSRIHVNWPICHKKPCRKRRLHNDDLPMIMLDANRSIKYQVGLICTHVMTYTLRYVVEVI